MNVILTPTKLKGDIIIPPSKSLSHRAIIAASLADGTSKISNIIYSDDILATIDAMRGLGAHIDTYENYLIPISIFLMISFTYWLIIHHLKKESRLFYLLEKKKKEIYE